MLRNPTLRVSNVCTMPPVHVIGYLRVSTEEQARSGLGLEAQRSRILDEADRRSWHVTWIVDDGYTAANLNRPGITDTLSSLRSGEADAVVVSKLDRLSRSLLDFAALTELARKEGWAVIALDLGVDMTTPAGEMLANVLASFAQYERRLISQRTKDALSALRASGRKLGRPRVVSAATAASIGRWVGSGCSLTAIAAHLNATGVPTAHGGRQWYPSTVRAVHRSHVAEAVV